MEDYDSDEIGALDDQADDEEMIGQVQESDTVFENMLDEFLDEHHDRQVEVIPMRSKSTHGKVPIAATQETKIEACSDEAQNIETGSTAGTCICAAYRFSDDGSCQTMTFCQNTRKSGPGWNGTAKQYFQRIRRWRIGLQLYGSPVRLLPAQPPSQRHPLHKDWCVRTQTSISVR
jgi:hypothetical protein